MKDDFALIGALDAAWDATAGCAHATIYVLRDGEPLKSGRLKAVATVKAILERYRAYVTTVKPLAFEYHDGMDEAQLRAWAARVAEGMRK